MKNVKVKSHKRNTKKLYAFAIEADHYIAIVIAYDKKDAIKLSSLDEDDFYRINRIDKEKAIDYHGLEWKHGEISETF